MYRKLYQELLEWKNESQGKSAIMIDGARRVGKSYLAEEFAKNEYNSYILIDFYVASTEVKELFEKYLDDLDTFFMRISAYYSVKLYERKTIFIFDEVQFFPRARAAIKYLVADGRYDYLETGSLLSIKKNTQNILIPSEEHHLKMNPMDFEEFLLALKEEALFSVIKQCFEKKQPMGQALHRKAMDLFRLYLIVGGMPQAVNEYLNTNNLAKVDAVKRRIIKLYSDDFLKIDSTGKLSKLFMAIPAQLSKKSTRFYTNSVVGELEESAEAEMLINLEDSKAVLVSYHSNDPNVGMSFTQDISKYKLFVADTGLFVTMVFWDKDFAENVIYQKLLADKLEANLGYIYGNLVAQMLTASGNKLFYYTFEKDEKHSYEIDFLLSRGNKICPIEVKSSGYKTHASLDAFRAKYSARIKNSYLLYTKDFKIGDNELMYVPFYMTGML